MATPPPLNPNTNQLAQTKKFCNVFFLTLAILGSGVFYYFKNSILGGVGLSVSLFSLVSFFHFLKVTDRQSKHADTKMSWFLLGVCLVGLLLIAGNAMSEGIAFYYGIGAGMSMMGGIAYGLELMLTWLHNLR